MNSAAAKIALSKGERTGKDIWRNAHQLALAGTETEALDDGRQEKRDAIHCQKTMLSEISTYFSRPQATYGEL